MTVNSKRMARAEVRTKSGLLLGRLMSLELDAESGKVAFLHVRVSGVLPQLLTQKLLIAWSQVISLGETEIVVDDAVVPAPGAFAVQPLTS